MIGDLTRGMRIEEEEQLIAQLPVNISPNLPLVGNRRFNTT